MRFRQPRYMILLLLVMSLLGNIALLWVAKQQYMADNTLRLDPLQLAVYPNVESPKTRTRVVFFGDSRALSWPAPALEGFEFVNRGIGQQTSSQIQLRFEQHIRPLQADWVVLQLCVNDLKAIPLFPNQRDSIIAKCESNIDSIIQLARQSGSKVLITTVFPLGKVPIERWPFWSGEVATAIETVNQYIHTLAASDVVVLDTYRDLLGDARLIRPEYSRDLLHLNAEGYKRINKTLVTFLGVTSQQAKR